jgi:hypothetical protein
VPRHVDARPPCKNINSVMGSTAHQTGVDYRGSRSWPVEPSNWLGAGWSVWGDVSVFSRARAQTLDGA